MVNASNGAPVPLKVAERENETVQIVLKANGEDQPLPNGTTSLKNDAPERLLLLPRGTSDECRTGLRRAAHHTGLLWSQGWQRF